MFIHLLGLLTLSFLPWSVLGSDDDRDARLYRVDITLPPKEGRDETADILQINATVEGLTDIEVLFSFKEVGNPKVLLVIDVEKACSWPQLTSFLSRKGYEVKTTPVYRCSDYAQELGVNMSRDIYDSSLKDDEDLLLGRQIFQVKDLTTAEFNEKMKQMFVREKGILEAGQRGACFRSLASLPVELIHFGPVSPSRMDTMEETLRGPETFDMELSRMQNLAHYSQGCQK
ncbi:uncharacterized protein LOC124120747 [Haliotis rufescens]|uniref:uncharacterized protein LOC124120747 n=1 Tax=Haliotis rufescens TaxID=6454 RepID=UPI00201F61D9|nr:uncharacterized protein LOC124120747 [Haliotis rufescens]XP_048251468.1 uncharacterized protein LOC124120747 [Haliotis rufescens]